MALPDTGNRRVPDPLIVSPPGISVVEEHLAANGTDRGRAAQIARACGGSSHRTEAAHTRGCA